MKIRNKLLIALSVLLVVLNMQDVSAQKNKKQARLEKKQAEYKQVKTLVESRDFVFDAQRAFPTGVRSIDLTTNRGTIVVKNDSVVGNLPFFGRSYTSSYGGDSGIKFQGEIKEEKLEPDDKKFKIGYSFKISSGNDTYNVYMDIQSDGSASVNIQSNNRTAISYMGKIEKKNSEKKK